MYFDRHKALHDSGGIANGPKISSEDVDDQSKVNSAFTLYLCYSCLYYFQDYKDDSANDKNIEQNLDKSENETDSIESDVNKNEEGDQSSKIDDDNDDAISNIDLTSEYCASSVDENKSIKDERIFEVSGQPIHYPLIQPVQFTAEEIQQMNVHQQFLPYPHQNIYMTAAVPTSFITTNQVNTTNLCISNTPQIFYKAIGTPVGCISSGAQDSNLNQLNNILSLNSIQYNEVSEQFKSQS